MHITLSQYNSFDSRIYFCDFAFSSYFQISKPHYHHQFRKGKKTFSRKLFVKPWSILYIIISLSSSSSSSAATSFSLLWHDFAFFSSLYFKVNWMQMQKTQTLVHFIPVWRVLFVVFFIWFVVHCMCNLIYFFCRIRYWFALAHIFSRHQLSGRI